MILVGNRKVVWQGMSGPTRHPYADCDGLQTMVEGATSGPTVRAYGYPRLPAYEDGDALVNFKTITI